jgi:glycosyltransferase involved in cell wall biosynthesis
VKLRVSICIPCHNAAPYLSAALDSALAQTWKDLEVIVVNDGSTDGSSGILDSYRTKGVRVICERFGSAAKARNRAFAAATGDYIKFFDADDLLSPKSIERQMERLGGRTDAVASAGWGRFYNNDLASFRLDPESVWKDMEAANWLVEAWVDARPMMQPGLFLIPRPILEAAGGWDESLTLIDDFEFFARVLCHSHEVLFTPGAALYYRSGLNGSLSGRKSRAAVESAFHSLMRGTFHLLARRDDPEARRACANVLQDFIHTYYPGHPDLRARVATRVAELGGSHLPPDGPPRFQELRKLIGWKLARRVQRLVSP